MLSLSQENYQEFGNDDYDEYVNASQYDHKLAEYNMELGGPCETHMDFVAHTNMKMLTLM